MVAPGIASQVATGVADELLEDLRRRYDSVEWRTELRVVPLVARPSPLMELVEAARRILLEEGWDLVVAVTDLPLRARGRPLARHLSRTHRVALVSLPALGVFQLGPRLRRTLIELAGELVGDPSEQGDPGGEKDEAQRRRTSRVLSELATDRAEPDARTVSFVPAVLLGHVRLLLGMVRANRPWRLAARLYGALVAAFATGALGLVHLHFWLVSLDLPPWRLAVLAVVSIVVTVAAIVLAHGLWERTSDPSVRDQIVLFNLATVATLAIGILVLYAVLFALILGGAALLVTPAVVEHESGSPVSATDYVLHAWFMASLATLAGALGAGLESEEAVREAAYGARLAGR